MNTPSRKIEQKEEQTNSPYRKEHGKSTLLLKLDSDLRTSYLISLANTWDITLSAERRQELQTPQKRGNDNETPKAKLLNTLRTHLQSKQLSGKVIRGIFYIFDEKLYLLPASEPTLQSEQTIGEKTEEQIGGIRSVRNRLKDDYNYRKFIHLAVHTIQDDKARRACEQLTKETKEQYYPILEYSTSNPNSSSDEMSDEELKISEYPPDIDFLEVNANEAEETTFKTSTPKIEKFTDKHNVDSWVTNQQYILEMGGLRDPRKVISHLLGGLEHNLLQAVRQELQTKQQENLTTEDFKEALRNAAHQTDDDLIRQMKNLKFDSEKMPTMKDLYLKITAINTALYPKIQDKETKERMDTEDFRKKVPKSIRENSNFQISDLKGYELVNLAQKLADANRVELEANFLDSRSNTRTYGRGSRGGYRGGYRGGSRRGNRGGRYQNRHRGQYQQKCNYCGIPGHKEFECRKKRAQRNQSNRGDYYGRSNPNRPHYRKDITCRFCEREGHMEFECRTKQKLKQDLLRGRGSKQGKENV